jgi:hypothetical protein
MDIYPSLVLIFKSVLPLYSFQRIEPPAYLESDINEQGFGSYKRIKRGRAWLPNRKSTGKKITS